MESGSSTRFVNSRETSGAVLWRQLLHSPSTGEFNCQLISYLTKRASKRPAALHHVANPAIELLIALIL